MVTAMGALKALGEFFSRAEPLLAPMNDPFIHVDRELLAAQLKLKERGAVQGEVGLPPADAGGLDNVEMEVVTKVGEHYARAQIETTNSVRTYDRRLSELALLSRLSSIRTEAKRAVSDFKAEVANRLNRISVSRDAVASSYAHLCDFRTEHGLRRPAHAVPPSIATTGTIAVAWLAETIMNAFLLRLNDEMGYLGGVVAAATVGAINVLVAAFVGRQLWPLTHLKDRRQLLGWMGVSVWVVFVVWWNLLAAHFRDAKSMGLEAPEREALTMMGSGLDSIYSWGLLAAGIIFAVTAARAGYRQDDPYPGYGDVSRRHDQACDDYADEVELASEELVEIRNEAIEGATEVRQELERQLAEHNQILTARAAYIRRFGEYGDQLEQLANALLQEYRGANRSSRSAPEPPHFKTSWKMPRTSLPPAATASINSTDVADAERALDGAVSEIVEAFTAAIERFEPIDNLKKGLSRG